MSEWNYDKSGIEIDIRFLACVEFNSVDKYILILKKRDDKKYADQYGDVFEECEIIAWMPLPDAPKKETPMPGCQCYL